MECQGVRVPPQSKMQAMTVSVLIARDPNRVLRHRRPAFGTPNHYSNTVVRVATSVMPRRSYIRRAATL